MQWRNKNNVFNRREWKRWIEPTPREARRKTKIRTRKSFRGFSHHCPSSVQGLQGWQGFFFFFLVFYVNRMSIFSPFPFLCRTLYPLETKVGCNSDKEKQVYVCVRDRRKNAHLFSKFYLHFLALPRLTSTTSPYGTVDCHSSSR